MQMIVVRIAIQRNPRSQDEAVLATYGKLWLKVVSPCTVEGTSTEIYLLYRPLTRPIQIESIQKSLSKIEVIIGSIKLFSHALITMVFAI